MALSPERVVYLLKHYYARIKIDIIAAQVILTYSDRYVRYLAISQNEKWEDEFDYTKLNKVITKLTLLIDLGVCNNIALAKPINITPSIDSYLSTGKGKLGARRYFQDQLTRFIMNRNIIDRIRSYIYDIESKYGISITEKGSTPLKESLLLYYPERKDSIESIIPASDIDFELHVTSDVYNRLLPDIASPLLTGVSNSILSLHSIIELMIDELNELSRENIFPDEFSALGYDWILTEEYGTYSNESTTSYYIYPEPHSTVIDVRIPENDSEGTVRFRPAYRSKESNLRTLKVPALDICIIINQDLV